LHPEEKNILIIDIFIGISLVVISIILFRKKKKK
jgi:LPXTG-motif cell wall-anchored protein